MEKRTDETGCGGRLRWSIQEYDSVAATVNIITVRSKIYQSGVPEPHTPDNENFGHP